MDDELEDIRERKREELKDAVGDGGTAAQPGEGESEDAAPTEPIHVGGADDLDRIVGTYDVVLVDFYADWCGPCQMLEPIVETLAAETGAAVAKVDVDVHQALAQQFQVRGVPTLVLFSGGEAVEQITGVRGEDELRGLIERYV